MPNEIELDVDQDIIRQAYVRVFQALRVGSAGTLRNPVRATTRGGVTFACRWLGMDAQPHDEVPIDDLPIILPRGGGYGIHFDPDPGDPVVVLALDGPPSQFYASGQVVTPQFPQHNDYACSVLFPGGRISSPETPTQPPNAAGEMLVGAEDGTATLLLRRRAGPNALEQGTVVIKAATHVPPAAAILLGGDGAVLGVARLNDSVSASAAFLTWASQVTAAINGLVPGAVAPPFVGPAIGTIASASQKVASE